VVRQRVAGRYREEVVVHRACVASREDTHAGLAVRAAEDPGGSPAVEPGVDERPDVGRLDRLDRPLGPERLREPLARLRADPQ